MRDQKSPPPLNNTLIGIITSTLSSWGIKIRHLLRTICWLGNNINFIFMRDQNLPPRQNNMLIGEITSTLSSWGVRNLPPPMTNMLNGVITSILPSWGIKIRKAGHQLRANVQVAVCILYNYIRLHVYIYIYTKSIQKCLVWKHVPHQRIHGHRWPNLAFLGVFLGAQHLLVADAQTWLVAQCHGSVNGPVRALRFSAAQSAAGNLVN